jgi:alpha-galactosidase/6-phospho-beta-glucosidase family protein
MLALEEFRMQIPEYEHIRSERRFTMDEERLSLEKRKFEHQKDQERIKMELERKERESIIKLVNALENNLLQ